MLSYQHVYHAGNFADVHKHMLLSWMLAYLVRKPKPLSYIETHAGSGAYDLTSPAAEKTQEAAQGINRLQTIIDMDHPYAKVIRETRSLLGPTSYPGSPLIAAGLLRPEDSLHLCELHPGEFRALEQTMSQRRLKLHNTDGLKFARAVCPPTPRRGLLFIDPSYEVKKDYVDIPAQIAKITRAWNVGIIALWYPVLRDNRQNRMLDALEANHPTGLRHEVTGKTSRDSHAMVGSGLFIVNAPYGTENEAQNISEIFESLK